ncbi:uncharacterized protein LOC118433925 [Folsomia candida]|uniref:uncharacterized protein LOC118433925 n=1 Tax=Folsomia candida TaxID=158441 RepID=UPI001605443E|nr:uncharacterized protein LOC118433925 [Folsomia candida]
MPSCLTTTDEALPVASNHSSYLFPAFFAYFFNISFVLLVSPFWIETLTDKKNKTSYTMKSYFCHKVTSGAVVTLGFISFLIYVLYLFDTVDIVKEPERSYELFRNLCVAMYTFLLIHLMWRRKANILHVVRLCPTMVVGSANQVGKK